MSFLYKTKGRVKERGALWKGGGKQQGRETDEVGLGQIGAEYLSASGNNDGPSKVLNNLYQDRRLLHQSL